MIVVPYFIQEARPDEDARRPNIYIQFNSCELDKLTETIIHCITSIMSEFCSETYGHGIKINSFDDFCDKYWEIHGIQIQYWRSIFRAYYFLENQNIWVEWNIDNYKDEIYSSYLMKTYPLAFP